MLYHYKNGETVKLLAVQIYATAPLVGSQLSLGKHCNREANTFSSTRDNQRLIQFNTRRKQINLGIQKYVLGFRLVSFPLH